MLIKALVDVVSGCIGAADNMDGSYRLDFEGQSSRLATSQEISDATAIAAKQDVPPVEAHRLKLALDQMGLLDSIEAWVLLQPKGVQVAWREAPAFARTSPMLNTAAASFGMSDAEVDAVFALASSLVV